jgi:hypothetical protein
MHIGDHGMFATTVPGRLDQTHCARIASRRHMGPLRFNPDLSADPNEADRGAAANNC